ncbi:MAG: hypothetical protein ACO1TE_06890 [Prosthecobacter sp.]
MPAPSHTSKKPGYWLCTLALGVMFGTAALGADLSGVRSLFVDQSARPDPGSLAAFDLSVLHPQAAADMEPGHALGSRYLALLDVTRFSTGTQAAMVAAERAVAAKPLPADARTRLVDAADPQWLPWVVEALVDPAAKRGFDGFVLSLGKEAATPSLRKALLTLTAAVHQRYPDKCLLLDARSGIASEALHLADGFLALGVYSQEGRNGALDWTPIAEVQHLTRHLRHLQVQGLRTFAVDYAPADDRAAAREAAQRLTAIGALPFITTPALSGVNLGPLEETSRRVFVLHGWDESHTGQAAPAAESTVSARFLRQPLEWLGCQPDFRTARGVDFLPEAQGLRAVILDSGLVLSDEQQRVLAAWLPRLRARNIPLLLTGMPFTNGAVREVALRHLALGGGARPASRLAKVGVAKMDSALLRDGARVQARSLGFLDLTAPADARLVLALRGHDTLGGEHRFDPVFLAGWGGAWIDPAVEAAGPQIDLPAFLTAFLGQTPASPVPDTTTREGRQVFYSHIDGAGFSTPSTLPGFPACAEVMRDRILDRCMLPVTVAVCEAEVRGWLPDQDAGEAAALEHTARSIFNMPQVQAASGSFSRPERWTAGVDIATKLNERAQTVRRDMEREIAGSMTYIHRQLLPQGKDVRLMLWPQNAAPTREALRFCESMGIETLPASATSSLEEGRPSARLEPRAVRCRFDDMRTEQGIKALEKTFDACAGEPLHAMTASAYAASVRDARQTRILRVSDTHWIILNNGDCRTLRLPASAGVPDMTQCLGVSGFNVHQGQLYIHTMGNARTELVLTQARQAGHLRLVECSAAIQFMELSSRRATFHVRDLRPVEVVLAGFEPRGQCAYLENGRPYTAHADAEGVVRLEIVCRATVSVQAMAPATQAAMR